MTNKWFLYDDELIKTYNEGVGLFATPSYDQKRGYGGQYR